MSNFIKMLTRQEVRYVDFRFTDLHGVWHHVAYPVHMVDSELMEQGIFFDGSSLPGWCAINESDMLLRPDPDPEKIIIDPFAKLKTAVVFCDVYDPATNTPYDRDPRTVGKKAMAFLRSSKIADTAFFGPEAEFFLFDGVEFSSGANDCGYRIYGSEFYDDPSYNHGHRPGHKGGYFPVAPVDSSEDIRAQMCDHMSQMGIGVEKHHHEVAPGQQEIGIRRDTLITSADHIQIYKYVVRRTAVEAGQTATFMPKPLYGDNGSGMHVHQSLWLGKTPLFSGDGYAGLSQTALYYIGGILKHARSLNALTNPTTNSYRRLIPGFEAPVIGAYSMRNRSASCRIPFADTPAGRRIEARFPDPTANPYLAFSAMLMAGLDGIRNQIHPGEPCHLDLFEHKEEAAGYKSLCGSLEAALNALEEDLAYLLEGGVFTQDLLDSYLALKREEVKAMAQHPHPWEFVRYFSR